LCRCGVWKQVAAPCDSEMGRSKSEQN
jgi:hypothetical protein